jgi:hypothetical protein
VEIARKSLEAVGTMAKFNFVTLSETGVSGLHQQQAANPNVLFDILKFLMNFILFRYQQILHLNKLKNFSDFSVDLLDAASDALFGIICSEQKTYRVMVEQLIQQQTDSVLQNRLISAFNKLMVNITFSLDRKSMEKFRESMQEFLTSVKSFLLTK